MADLERRVEVDNSALGAELASLPYGQIEEILGDLAKAWLARAKVDQAKGNMESAKERVAAALAIGSAAHHINKAEFNASSD